MHKSYRGYQLISRRLLPVSLRVGKDIHVLQARRLCTIVDNAEVEVGQINMELKDVVKKLASFAAPTLAGSWDNVGLLVEPTPPHTVTKLLLTNDLTTPVMEEAIQLQANMILSYHPPIFVPLKRLTQSSWKERLIVQSIENRIAIYSPHTSYDAVQGGVNDWIIKPFEGKVDVIERVKSNTFCTQGRHKLEFSASKELITGVNAMDKDGVTLMSLTSSEDNLQHACYNCTDKGLDKVLAVVNVDADVKATVQLTELQKPPIPRHGPGRIVKLTQSISIGEVVKRVKEHLQLKYVRLALALDSNQDSMIKSIAVCAGSGSSVLHGVCADMYISGEMSHHEVLDATQRKRCVILCDHSNTERGFLNDLQAILSKMLDDKVTVCISTTDKDPLEIV